MYSINRIIWRPSLQTSSVKSILRLCPTNNMGVESLVKPWTWKLITAGIRFDDLRMEKVQDNNGSYNIVVQVIDRSKKVLFRSYVFIPRENKSSMTGSGPWHKPVSLTLLTKSSSCPNSPKRFSVAARSGLIPRYTRCFENYMNVSMALFGNIENWVKIV